MFINSYTIIPAHGRGFISSFYANTTYFTINFFLPIMFNPLLGKELCLPDKS